jgi:hypothetical protein
MHNANTIAARITAKIESAIEREGLASIEALLVRGVGFGVELALADSDLEALRYAKSGLTPEEWVSRWSRLTAISLIEVPRPTIDATWNDLRTKFTVRIAWTPERKPWGGVVVPNAMPREGL